jgi:hypothetical protein
MHFGATVKKSRITGLTENSRAAAHDRGEPLYFRGRFQGRADLMPNSRKHRLTQRERSALDRLQNQSKTRLWSIKYTLNTWWKRFVGTIAFIASIFGVGEVLHEALKDPEIYPNTTYTAESLIAFPLIVKNKSMLFAMRNVKLTCILVRVVYEGDGGWTLTMPTNLEPNLTHISEQTNAIIESDDFVNFPCDSTNMVRDPRLNNKPMKLKAEQVRAEITYETKFIRNWSRTYKSHNFRRDAASGFQWIPGEFIR